MGTEGTFFRGSLTHAHARVYIVPLITCIDKHSAFNQAFQSDEYSIISIYEGKTSNRIQAHKNNWEVSQDEVRSHKIDNGNKSPLIGDDNIFNIVNRDHLVSSGTFYTYYSRARVCEKIIRCIYCTFCTRRAVHNFFLGGSNSHLVDIWKIFLLHLPAYLIPSGSRMPVSYTHLTLPTNSRV